MVAIAAKLAGNQGGSSTHPSGGTVTSVSVATANGFSGTVADPTTTPAITIIAGAITPTTVNGLTITASALGVLTIAAAKTFTVNNTLTLDGNDGTTINFAGQVKTANFNALAGSLYQVDTTSGELTATLPAAPAIGDTIELQDAAEMFGTNHLIILRNGNKINSVADDFADNISGDKLTATYISSTIGWKIS